MDGTTLNMTNKQCNCCKQVLPLNQFAKDASRQDKHSNRCRSCQKQYSLKHYHANKAKYGKMQSTYRRTVNGLFNKAKSQAVDRNLSWSITLEQYKNLRDQNCSYCSQPLPPAGVGLDRINSDKGYVLSNVVPCCSMCNSVKMHFSIKQLITHLPKMLKGLKKVYGI